MNNAPYRIPNYIETSDNKSIVKVFAMAGTEFMLISALAFGGGDGVTCNLLEQSMPRIYEMPIGENGISLSFDNNESIISSVHTYTNSSDADIGVAYMYINEDMRDNLDQLDMIEQLEDNWNGEGAAAFSKELVKKVRNIIIQLNLQPEVFPTARDSIQLEYYINNKYLEVEFNEQPECKVFSADEFSNTSTKFINADAEEINKVVDLFYGI